MAIGRYLLKVNNCVRQFKPNQNEHTPDWHAPFEATKLNLLTYNMQKKLPLSSYRHWVKKGAYNLQGVYTLHLEI
jgi:hypothetical protein